MNKFNDFTEVMKPNKTHQCVWCHEKILPGVFHLKYVGIYEGDFQNWRIHIECKKPMYNSNTYEEFTEICPGPHGRGEECIC